MKEPTTVKRVPRRLLALFKEKGWSDTAGFNQAYNALVTNCNTSVTDCNKTVTFVTADNLAHGPNAADCNIYVTEYTKVVTELLTAHRQSLVKELLTERPRVNDATKEAMQTYDMKKILSGVLEEERKKIALQTIAYLQDATFLVGRLNEYTDDKGIVHKDIKLNLRVPHNKVEEMKKILEE